MADQPCSANLSMDLCIFRACFLDMDKEPFSLLECTACPFVVDLLEVPVPLIVWCRDLSQSLVSFHLANGSKTWIRVKSRSIAMMAMYDIIRHPSKRPVLKYAESWKESV